MFLARSVSLLVSGGTVRRTNLKGITGLRDMSHLNIYGVCPLKSLGCVVSPERAGRLRPSINLN